LALAPFVLAYDTWWIGQIAVICASSKLAYVLSKGV
jgi:hypothetical protein